MDNISLWLWLSQKDHISAKVKYKLLDDFGSVENIYNSRYEDLSDTEYLQPEAINDICDKGFDFEKLYERCRKENIRILCPDSPLYPEMLKKLTDYPFILYCKGQMLDLNKYLCMAVVGTRKLSAYGAECALNLSREMAERGAVIISGMASGIDAKAHKGALDAGMPTVAVLGCGVNIAYPRSNARLMEEIAKTGMIISEYPPDTEPAKYRFPERNRIISGISYATLVVEADVKSGSLITAKYCYEQGKDVFAVPGNINSPFSKGTNYLIKDGAYLAENCDDIMTAYEIRYPRFIDNGKNLRFAQYHNSEKTAVTIEEKKEIAKVENNSSTEDIILNILTNDSVSIDEIFELTGIDIAVLNTTLLIMELGGKIVKLPGNRYTRK